MTTGVHIEQLNGIDKELEGQLGDLLVRVVDDGASVGFLPPLSVEEATDYWGGVPGEGVLLWVAKAHGEIAGSVQLHLAMKPNGLHRAEIAKLMVDPKHRRQGIARKLMETAEASAASDGRTLLVLDTRGGDPSNLLYQSLGFTEAGRIPDYARSANGELHETVFYYKTLR
ncbi:GNAT family N-acetyltransferase [Paenibacillus sabinae]|uniref:N-acetyltransferase GCN5 n=1 Tax=Paenibacillus sabinae T27 TaxID=1268072 RepID=X4ZWA4_9BACL|nr:GNAT family N-acetyltransferase [Paenibacillus sabinae]AHV96009.1 N-acetyltransferase GCN5 [Paenibacillus sabinae T27]